MKRPAIHEQLLLALQASGLSDWELARRANVTSTLVAEAISGSDDVRVDTLVRLARALELDLTLAPSGPEPYLVGTVPTVVDHAAMRLSPKLVVHATEPVPYVLALDLEGTLISKTASMSVRPGLFKFLTCCRPLFPRVVMFTDIQEPRFRQIAAALVEEGSAPPWFLSLEYIHWSGSTKNLAFVPDAEVEHVLLVDHLEQHVHSGQQAQWVPIRAFEPQFEQDDVELDRVLEELARRVFQASAQAHS